MKSNLDYESDNKKESNNDESKLYNIENKI